MASTNRKRTASDAVGADTIDGERGREIKVKVTVGRQPVNRRFCFATVPRPPARDNHLAVGDTAGGYPSPPGSPSSSSGTLSVTSTPDSAAASPKCPLGDIANSPKKNSKTSKKAASSRTAADIIHDLWQIKHRDMPLEAIKDNPRLNAIKHQLKIDPTFLEDAIRKGDVSLKFHPSFLKRRWGELHKDLLALCEHETNPLLIGTHEQRDTHHSGFTTDETSGERTMKLLESIPEFCEFFADIKTKFEIKHCWVAWYGEDGWHPFHQDGRYRGTHRIILSLGCFEKEMWFNKLNSMCGINIRHAGTVTLSRTGGGVIGNMSHNTCKTGKSLLFAFEVEEK